MVVAGFVLLVLGAAMVLPWGLSGGSANSRYLGDSYVRLSEGFRREERSGYSWRRFVVGLAVGSVGALLLIIGL